MHVIRSSTYVTMPWKNGGGTTTEIAVFPPGAGMSDFGWRFSMARVESGGPFSSFPGIDRSIAILEGDGLTLMVEGEDDVCLDKTLAPFPFPGDVMTRAELTGAAVTDLNLMTRRESWRHALVRAAPATGKSTITRAGEIALVLARGATLDTETRGARLAVGDGDTLVIEETDPPEVTVDVRNPGTGHLYIAHLWRR